MNLTSAYEALREALLEVFYFVSQRFSPRITYMTVPYSKTVADKRRLLKIKLKSLATEAKIIRQEEDRLRGAQKVHLQDLRREMAEHRRGIVRSESRHTGLAYAFIRGKGYREVEPRGVPVPVHGPGGVDMGKVLGMIHKYGSQKIPLDLLVQWFSAPMRDKPPRRPKKPYTRPAVDAVQATA